MVVAQEAPHTRQTVVILLTQHRRTVLLRAGRHRTELVDRKRTSAVSDPFLLEDGRTSILAFDQQPDNQKGRCKHDQTQHTSYQIEEPLGTFRRHGHLTASSIVAFTQADVQSFGDDFRSIISHNDIDLNTY